MKPELQLESILQEPWETSGSGEGKWLSCFRPAWADNWDYRSNDHIATSHFQVCPVASKGE